MYLFLNEFVLHKNIIKRCKTEQYTINSIEFVPNQDIRPAAVARFCLHAD